jgi:hypothetical protein
MKKQNIFFTVLLLALFSLLTNAQIPRVLSYQGILTDSIGNPKPDGSYMITFRLYELNEGGSEIWSEQKTLQVKRGLFSTTLGDRDAFGDDVKFERAYWLGLQVESEPELSPRIPLTAVGYSLNSTKSDTAKFAHSTAQQMFVDSARIAGTIPDNAITTNKILDGTIQRVDVAEDFTAPYSDTAAYARVAPQSGFVDSARIAGLVPDNSITNSKLASGSVTSAKIPASQVVKSLNSKYDNITLTAAGGATITSSGDTIIINAGSGGGGTGIQGVQNTNNTLDIIDPNGPTATINVKNSGITSAQIADAAVGTNKIADNTITSAKIADGTIVTADLGDNSTTSAKIVDGTIATADLANNSVTSVKIVDGAIVTADLGDNSVTSAKIANAAITPAKLNSSGAGVGQAMIWNGLNVIWGNPDGGLMLPYVDSASSSSAAAFQIINTSTTGTAYGVFGKSNSTSGVGVRGYAPRTGVSGYASNTTGTAYGFYGETPSTSGYGVFGAATASSGTTYGIYGRSYSDDGYGIYGRAPLYGVYGLASATSGINYGLYGTSSSVWGRGVYGAGQLFGVEARATATDVVNYGVYGSSASTIGYGVYGVNVASSGANFGVYGESYSTSGRGVQGISPYLGTYGRSEMTTGLSYGVYGRSNSTDGYGVYGTSPSIGVYGVSTATSGEKVGVYGRTYSADGSGVWGHGVEAGVVGTLTSNSGAAIIGYGNANGGKAAIFNGFVAVMGELYKSSGSFRIDHPLDPENKYLFHSFVESPERKNIYDGTVILDYNGTATIILPDWFGALNKEFRYQLTAIGTSGPNLYIASEVHDNQFKIAGGTSGMKVSWQVTGIRKDAYAERYPQPIEEFKQGRERGKYLHPELYGKPREEGIGALQNPKLSTETMKDDENLSSPKPPALDQKAPSQSDEQ